MMNGRRERERERQRGEPLVNIKSHLNQRQQPESFFFLFSFFSVYLLTVLCLAEPGLLFSVLFAAAAATAVRHVVGRVCAMS